MSKKNDPSQLGGVPGNAPKSVRPIAKPDGIAIIKSAGRDVAREYARHATPKHPPGPNEQDWRKG